MLKNLKTLSKFKTGGSKTLILKHRILSIQKVTMIRIASRVKNHKATFHRTVLKRYKKIATKRRLPKLILSMKVK